MLRLLGEMIEVGRLLSELGGLLLHEDWGQRVVLVQWDLRGMVRGKG